MKPSEQMEKMIEWLEATAHGVARFDAGVGDADKGNGKYFRRDGLKSLSVVDLHHRLGFFRAANARGVDKAPRPLNIYICGAVAHSQSWLMMDDLTLEQCRRVAGDRAYMVAETSPGRHHLWLATSRLVSVAERKACQQVLQRKFGGDAGSTSGDHFGRLCGFKNAKRSCWVNFIEAVVVKKRADVDVLLAFAEVEPSLPLPPRGAGARAVDSQAGSIHKTPASSFQPSDRDESAAEYAFACAHYDKKLDVEDGIQKLAQRALARGKRTSPSSSEAYARKTFDHASKRS